MANYKYEENNTDFIKYSMNLRRIRKGLNELS